MIGYRLSRDAEQDLVDIYLYSVERFGSEQAERYLADLTDRFDLIANAPARGRDFALVLPGLRRLNHQSHAIYYTVAGAQPLILRVLHQRMDPARHIHPPGE